VERVCFQLRIKPEHLGEYRARHAAVWPDMLQALERSGYRNYSIFLADDGLLIGYFETDSLEASQADMAATEVNARWQADMAPFFDGLDGAPDTDFNRLPEIFNLAAQLHPSS
jgi:L-rhamnose mutarotase